MLGKLTEWNFPIFQLQAICEYPLANLAISIFEKCDLFAKFAIPREKFEHFFIVLGKVFYLKIEKNPN